MNKIAEIIKETITREQNGTEPVIIAPINVAATEHQTIEYLIYFFFGALEVLLAFRLVLKITGASMASSFVGLIYGLTGIFIAPFEGIFRRGFSQGVETTSVLEPATVVAIVVYAIIAWGIVKLVRIASGTQQPTN